MSPTHPWCASNRLDLAHGLKWDACSQTKLSRLASGHIKCLSLSAIKKIFSICAKRQDHQVFPEHIMPCMDLTSKHIYTDPLLVLDSLRVTMI
ncbi:hypothetical protein TNCV_1242721 [Trichonephila clavipes]|nr:hypothetical protein TNCV_1242721 [Trichonephila clavipes]